jgi:hypothetical protein
VVFVVDFLFIMQYTTIVNLIIIILLRILKTKYSEKELIYAIHIFTLYCVLVEVFHYIEWYMIINFDLGDIYSI